MPAPRRKGFSVPEDQLAVPHECCWGKTFQEKPGVSVQKHCENVGCVAEALIRLIPLAAKGNLVTDAATILAAAHDIGKVSPGFQQKCPVWERQHRLPPLVYETDHAKVSQFTLQEILSSSALRPWAAILGAHHGGIKGEKIRQIRDTGGEPWRQERLRLLATLVQEFGPLPQTPPDEASLWFVAGLIAVADWIGSDERRFPQKEEWTLAERREKARQALTEIGWTTPQMLQGQQFADLFDGYEPRPLQRAAIGAIQRAGLYLIEGPMGCGKTEAALAAAYQLMENSNATGLYFALPTQTTSNRIHVRVKEFLSNAASDARPVRLAHGTSWLQDEQPPIMPDKTMRDEDSKGQNRIVRNWFSSSKRALLEPFGVGTIDQALLGIVAAQHFFVRQFGLAGKVVVLDEVHTYDLYTSTLIDTLIRRLRELQCTVVILSATLTKARRAELLGWDASRDGEPSAAYPLLSGRAGGGDGPAIQIAIARERPKEVRIAWKAEASIIDECLAHARAEQCVLWIRNTVESAQQTYRRLQSANQAGGPEIALLHARFPYFRREELEDIWMAKLGKGNARRPKGCVLVTTQVAEQSVDLDADLLITDLAPTDMIFQRMGRLWRHDDRPRPSATQPETWIIPPSEAWDDLRTAEAKKLKQALGKSAYVYAPYVLLRSYEQWRQRESVELPDDIRRILEATYSPPSANEPDGWRVLREELEENKRQLAAYAKSATAIWNMPALSDEEGVQTRWEKHSTVYLLLAKSVVPRGDQAAEIQLLNGDTIEADAWHNEYCVAKAIFLNLVRIPRWPVNDYLTTQPAWLGAYVNQSAVVGLCREGGHIAMLNEETDSGLSCSANEGLIISKAKPKSRVRDEEDYESYD